MTSYGPDAALQVDWQGSDKIGPSHAIYFFKRKQYIRWNVDEERLFDGYPKSIEEGWPGLLEVFPGVPLSGAMHVPGWHNKIYFFFRNQSAAVAWDVARHALEPEPVDVAGLMPSALTQDGNFTPLYVDDGTTQKVYAFQGDAYTRWTVQAGAFPEREDDGYPRRIGDGWTGAFLVAPACAVSVNWTRRSEALTNRKIYFFLGDLYTRWDVDTHTMNYRLDIPSGWKGWPDFE
ncbi:MAG: hemopexin repeat-containing protein [Methyloligellaceae bacterium]